MPYAYNQAAAAGAIAEEQWFVAPALAFTKFTSCVGIAGLAQNANTVFGLHLGLNGNVAPHNLFALGDVAGVMNLLQAHVAQPCEVVLFGEVGVWKTSSKAATDALEQALYAYAAGDYDMIDHGSGMYSASIVNGKIKIDHT